MSENYKWEVDERDIMLNVSLVVQRLMLCQLYVDYCNRLNISDDEISKDIKGEIGKKIDTIETWDLGFATLFRGKDLEDFKE